ncbi:MAG: creatininase [Desulfurococcales archaeon ex4484_42]|nr:MAG: creatininase [Desulfurococcales archaeon ex4484_42]
MSRFIKVWLTPGSTFDGEERVIAVVPIGSIERHGDHLPLGTDTIEATYVAEEVARELGAHLYPPIWYGSSRGLRRFPGTIDVDENALMAYVESVLRGIVEQGYSVVLIINGHGGNTNVLRLVARKLAFETGKTFIVISWWVDVAQDVRSKLFTSPGHAGEDETSAMLCIAPETVDMTKAVDHEVAPPQITVYSPIIEEYLYPKAVRGRASRASREKGCEWLKAVINDIVNKVQNVLKLLKSMKNNQ